jgi:hypothetical protein
MRIRRRVMSQCSTVGPDAYTHQAGTHVHVPVEVYQHTPPVPLEGEPSDAERSWWAAECDARERRRRAAAKGGRTTFERHGREHMSRIGRRGFRALAGRFGKSRRQAVRFLNGSGDGFTARYVDGRIGASEGAAYEAMLDQLWHERRAEEPLDGAWGGHPSDAWEG